MSLLKKQVVEVVEHLDVWEIMKNVADIEEQLTTDDTVIRELTRISKTRDQLEYQCQGLKVIFPNRQEMYDSQFRLQIEDLEKQICKLLPDIDFE